MSMYYVHKEPLFDRRKALFGNEFSFRTHASDKNGRKWPVLAVDEDIIGAMSSEGGFESLVGSLPAFFTLNVASMKGDAPAFFPKNVVFQIPEAQAADKEVLLRSVVLKRQGYRVAVDYTPSGRGFSQLHRIADFVRITTSSFLADQAVARFEGLSGKLVAAFLEDGEAFARLWDLGFEVFQGPFFVRSPGNGSPSISSSQQVLLRLYNDLRANKEVGAVERTFKDNPKLAYGLLQLLNSAYFRSGPKVDCIGHAIALLGYENLEKWVVLLLFTVDKDTRSHPLIEKALIRSRLMESLSLKMKEKSLADRAFITGMLSFMNVFFNMRSDEVTEKLNLVQEIQDALMRREGVLGILLALAEKADRQCYDQMEEETEALEISIEDVLRAETNALMDWRVLDSPLTIRLAQ
jgi:c-di-GMP-related signal transduction protein